MTKAKISEYDPAANNNTDVNNVNIAEGCAPSGINNAIREVMAALKRFQTGSDGDGVTVGGNLIVSGTSTVGTASATSVAFGAGTVTAPSITATGDTNTGIYFPAADTIAFTEGGVEAMRIDSNGILGLGVTPNAWLPGFKAIQLSNSMSLWGASGTGVYYSNNVYYDGARKYSFNGAAAEYEQGAGVHIWSTAASGTAGDPITFSERMRIDSAGNVGIGTSTINSYSKLHIAGGGSGAKGALRLSDAGGTNYWDIGRDNGIAGTFTFTLNDTERMRIDTSGNLLVGTTSDVTNGGFKFFPNYSRAGSSAVEIGHISGSASGEGFANFKLNGTTIGSITQSGTTATAYNTSSDYRLKHDIQPMTGALAKVAQLKPVTYKWNADGSDSQGFIAHELQEVVPECVTGEKDAVDADGNPQYQGIDTSFLVATLTAAIQELKAELDTVKAELETLKGS
jgi:hypothetical protein